MKHRCNLTLSPFYTYTNNKVKLRGKKRNSLSLPSYRNLTSYSVAPFGRSRGIPVIREIIPDFGEIRGGILTCDFWEATGRFRAKTDWQTRKSPQKALKEQKSEIFLKIFIDGQIFLSFNIQNTYNQPYMPTAWASKL